jgi:hypothetical protein
MCEHGPTKWTTKAGMSRAISNMHFCAAPPIPKEQGRQGRSEPATHKGYPASGGRISRPEPATIQTLCQRPRNRGRETGPRDHHGKGIGTKPECALKSID